jgi:hypothetical protein
MMDKRKCQEERKEEDGGVQLPSVYVHLTSIKSISF